MRLRTALYAFAAATLAACNPVGVCTVIGCFDGLIVRFASQPTGAFRVEAIVPGEAAPHVFDCPSGTCVPVMFENVMASRVTIRVTTAAGTRSQEFTPKYEAEYPNGRRCGAACRNATVTMQFPG
ncbi:hypothetical protein [Longimicrobium sp.]|jgi:hypothetical protein|uniref:hypothetical protein n=1 Tax=Longimicrobium sp. TaxID=2029185 RepID=UPI002F93C29C